MGAKVIHYQRILAYVATTVWAIAPGKLDDLLSVLAFRAAGGTFTPAEIQARIGSQQDASSMKSGNGIAVIPVRGVIAHRMGSMDDTSGGTSVERIGAMVDQVAADASIGTILYDFDTPGGTVPGVQELAAKMFALRGLKHQIAHINGMAASAGYWLAAQTDEIVSTPSGTAGSIGVFAAHQDLSKALEAEGINVTLISAGKYKVEGSPFSPLTDEAKAFLQASVDAAYGQFVKDVARGRGVSVSDVRGGYGEGRALSAKDAKAAGLIDRIATLDETVGRLSGRKQAAGMRAEDVSSDPALAAIVASIAQAEDEALSPALFEADRRRRLERF
jgi:signal peptide peptidase SppA